MSAAPRYLAFDIETAKVLPPDARNLLDHRPLGIACAAALRSDDPEPIVWHGAGDGRPSARMSREECGAMVAELEALAAQGYTLLTWNGLGFDLDILAEESDLVDRCARLALEHVDMMFQVVCSEGYGVALQKAAEGLRLPGKPDGMSGKDAPSLWAQGNHEAVLRYNIEDARLALRVLEASQALGELRWVTRRNTTGRMSLGGGWRRVRDALALPLPDTSWMSGPIPRERYAGWIPAHLRVAAGPPSERR
jgi:hypothetical protein